MIMYRFICAIGSQVMVGPRNEEQTEYPHVVLCLFRVITGRYVSKGSFFCHFMIMPYS